MESEQHEFYLSLMTSGKREGKQTWDGINLGWAGEGVENFCDSSDTFLRSKSSSRVALTFTL